MSEQTQRQADERMQFEYERLWGEKKALVTELRAVRAERDRLLEALEKIARHPHGGILVNIACAALAASSAPGDTG